MESILFDHHGKEQLQFGFLDPLKIGLLGQQFSSRCPPDIQPGTHIIAVCGIRAFKDSVGHMLSSHDEPQGLYQPEGSAENIISKGIAFFSSTEPKEHKAA